MSTASSASTVNTVPFTKDAAAFTKDAAAYNKDATAFNKGGGFNRDVNTQLNADSWKYATYSQSEVDRLLKIQAENITAAFTAKISAQQKLVKELVSTQEKTSRKVIDEVSDQIEQFNITSVKAADNHNEQMKTLMEKAQNEIEVQFEQVKADLDRTLMNDLKGVDKRMQHLEASIQSMSETKQSSNSQALIILVALSMVLSLANMIMLFVHH
jgi:Fe2+ transport system protein B